MGQPSPVLTSPVKESNSLSPAVHPVGDENVSLGKSPLVREEEEPLAAA
jgi:hypothetical protein